jgi:flavin reductase (DIM6/NTAB) family NADH-FMN oxidoreductase RutF
MPELDLKISDLDPQLRYKVLASVVVPRPIAFVTALMPDGRVNAAPHSFFNAFSEDPPVIALGLARRADGRLKDTTALAQANGEFVVNMVDEQLAQSMSDAAIEFPSEISEVEELGLETVPSTDIKTPRLKNAPFAYECRTMMAISFTPTRTLILGEVLRIHAREGLMDPKTLRVDLDRYRPVGRLFGDLYSYQRDIFELKRPSYEQWVAEKLTREPKA